jgi:hypothetical protein
MRHVVFAFRRPPYSDKHKSMLLDLSKYRYSLMLLFLYRLAICVRTCLENCKWHMPALPCMSSGTCAHCPVACCKWHMPHCPVACCKWHMPHCPVACCKVAHATLWMLQAGRCHTALWHVASGTCHTALRHAAKWHAPALQHVASGDMPLLPCGMLHVAHASSLMTNSRTESGLWPLTH